MIEKGLMTEHGQKLIDITKNTGKWNISLLDKKTKNMKPKISIITLGVNNLEKSFTFYKDGLGFPSKKGIEGDIAFFQLKGIWLALFPKDKLAQDAKVANKGNGFSGFTLAHIVTTKDEVDKIIKLAEKAGAKVTDQPHEREWGGYTGYIKDLDGYLWEIAWMEKPFDIK
jgi:predicted lactoylglutathione lyase